MLAREATRLEAEGRILTRDWAKYNGKKDVVFQPALMSPHELLMGMEWAARQLYSLSSIVERMARSRTGLWWNIARNVGYHLALRNFGSVGFNPEVGEGFRPNRGVRMHGGGSEPIAISMKPRQVWARE